ncbi:unnamed protein product [Rotaria sp. Silwood2]|nr:unnamed protein product [Rotaria sp. Silwood2]
MEKSKPQIHFLLDSFRSEWWLDKKQWSVEYNYDQSALIFASKCFNNNHRYSFSLIQNPKMFYSNIKYLSIDLLKYKKLEKTLISQSVTRPCFSYVTRLSLHGYLTIDSMKWYTGQVNENSEISYNAHHIDADDLLHGHILAHSSRETQSLLRRIQSSNDTRIHAALDDIRSRVAQFDASKTREDLHVFMRYLESRLRDLNNNSSNNDMTNVQQQQQQQSDNI